MPAVSFDLAAFRARYPELSAVSDSLLGAYFSEAGLYLDNTDNSRITDLTQRSVLLNLLTAHIAAVNGSGTGQVNSPGRISSASEGGVSVSYDAMPAGASGMQAWLQQTQYGASFWALTARYRSFLYTQRC